ncbi:MAG TPA: ABC transporter permease [Candidatus Methylomirabilis sp.]|nr:ABC transporter permease [Candidatus Methylomirabilis sp.]
MNGRAETARVSRVRTGQGIRAARRSSGVGATSRSIGLGALSVLVLLAIWYIVTAGGYISPVFLPSPPQVARQAQRYLADGSLFWHVVTSGRRVLGGFLLAAVVAVPLGIALGTSRTAKALFDPILSIIRPLPSLSWIPLTILWFGIDEGQKYAIVFMGTFASALLYVMESTRRVDPLLIKAAQNLGATRLDVLREVILPGALPGIISGLKVCLALAWTCVLSAEMVAATHGLGALIWFAKDWNNMALVMVGMVSISITVLVIDSLFRVIEDRILPWERHTWRREP